MAYKVIYSPAFRHDFERCRKRGLKIELINAVIDHLVAYGVAPAETGPHPLKGHYKGCMECHIKPDWLLIWRKEKDVLQIVMIATGTHSELFKK